MPRNLHFLGALVVALLSFAAVGAAQTGNGNNPENCGDCHAENAADYQSCGLDQDCVDDYFAGYYWCEEYACNRGGGSPT